MNIDNKELKMLILTLDMISNGEYLVEYKNTTIINQGVYQRCRIS